MIANDVQHRTSKAHLAQFESALANLTAGLVTTPARLHQLEIGSVQAKIDDFRREIAEYEGPLSTWGDRHQPPHGSGADLGKNSWSYSA